MATNDLLAYILNKIHDDVEQIHTLIRSVHTDVDFLVETGMIGQDDATLILSKTPSPVSQDDMDHHQHGSDQVNNSLLERPESVAASRPQYTTPDRLTPPATQPSYPNLADVNGGGGRRPPKKLVQARAQWDYNLDGEEPKDLSFFKGEIIEVVAETNADWWTGKVNGRTGLFPSNYVEKLVHPLPPALAAAQKHTTVPVNGNHGPYRSTHDGVQNGMHDPNQEGGKKTKYDTMKAPNGAGFGAGAAISHGLVRAIF